MVKIEPKFIIILLVLLSLVFGIAFAVQSAQVRRLNAQADEIQLKVLEAYAKTEELERRLEFMSTDAYVEQEARRRFGYMESDEIRMVLEPTPGP